MIAFFFIFSLHKRTISFEFLTAHKDNFTELSDTFPWHSILLVLIASLRHCTDATCYGWLKVQENIIWMALNVESNGSFDARNKLILPKTEY